MVIDKTCKAAKNKTLWMNFFQGQWDGRGCRGESSKGSME